jgi:peroxiredoxin
VNILKSCLALAAFLVLSAVGRADTSGQELAMSAGRSLIGTPAPRLTLTTIDGGTIDLGQFYGHKAVYLKFWATWCVPCRQQMPHFEHTYEHGGKDLVVIAVNAGFNDSLEDVKKYREQLGLKMPIVIDDGSLADALHLRVTPQHVVIGRDGRIAYIGHLVDDRLEAALAAARKAQGPPSQASVQTAALRRYRLGDRVSDAVLKMPDGAQLPLTDPDHRQSTVLVFLSPWCESYLKSSRPERAASCRRAREDSERLAVSSRLRFIGIASGLWATSEDLSTYRAEQHVRVPLYLDESGVLFRSFGVSNVPAFVVLDPTGHVLHQGDQLTGQLLAGN